MKKVILYCRVSTDEQADGCSLDEQERVLRAYCNNRGFDVVDVYREDYSAKHYDLRRPEMKKIYNYCKSHKKCVDLILFLRWDRFSRDGEFAYHYKRKFEEMGVQINAIESPIDFTSGDWPTLLGIYCGTAHSEDVKISKRTKAGIHGTLLKGKWSNRAPRGYKNVRTGKGKHDTHIEVDEKTAPLITRVFHEVALGLEKPCRIRRRLCKHIPESSFLDMLKNPFYIGKVRVPAYMDEPAQVVQGEHEAIVDEQTFYRVQDILSGKKQKKPKLGKVPHPDLFLRKFITCPVCGHALTGSFSRGNGGKYAYYHCCEDGKHLRRRAADVNKSFASYVGGLTPRPEVLDLYTEVLKDIRKDDCRDISRQIERLENDIKQIKVRLDSLDDKFVDGDISREQYERMNQRYEQDKRDKSSEVELLKEAKRSKIEPKLEYAINLISNLKALILEGATTTKIMVLGSIFPEKIEFDGEKYRTKNYNKVLDLIYQETKVLRGEQNEKKGESDDSPTSVPRAGVEPARVLPHWCLRPARLPIPPSGLEKRLQR